MTRKPRLKLAPDPEIQVATCVDGAQRVLAGLRMSLEAPDRKPGDGLQEIAMAMSHLCNAAAALVLEGAQRGK